MVGKFQLGRIVATPGAMEVATENDYDLLALLALHKMGEWGNVDAHDWKVNEDALRNGGRLVSSYGPESERLWIITEADRSSTCILRPEDY